MPEGRVLMVVEGSMAGSILERMRQLECCKKAEIIGSFENRNNKLVYMENSLGSTRIISALEGDLLPRIC